MTLLYKSDIPMLEISGGFLDTSFNYLYFRNSAVNFVEICNIYANQLAIKMTASIS